MSENIPHKRPVVIDVSGGKKSFKRRHKKNRNRFREHENSVHEPERQPVPIELSSVIDVIIAYGRKTNALGELKAATILSDISMKLRELGPPSEALVMLMHLAEKEAEAIRTRLVDAYEENEVK